MSNTVKIQVPIDKDVRDALERKAHSYGFDSVQAYIRFWAKAVVDNRRVDLEVDDWGEPSPEAADRLDKLADEAKHGINVSGPCHTVEEFMKDL